MQTLCHKVGSALTPTSGVQLVQAEFNTLSHTVAPLGITLEQLGTWVAISSK